MLMNNGVYDKTMENLRDTGNQQKRLLKLDIKTKLYVTKNIWQ